MQSTISQESNNTFLLLLLFYEQGYAVKELPQKLTLRNKDLRRFSGPG
jgi:hypothetical protein